ncbi:hypothetical protein ACFV6Z_18525 [Streptomyces sp. NPDC059818]
MTSEEALLLTLIALGLLNLAAIVTGWLADRHTTRTSRHLKEG